MATGAHGQVGAHALQHVEEVFVQGNVYVITLHPLVVEQTV